VVNGKAISLPWPVYPSSAKVARASGAVKVLVTIDETGKVIAARAISGHSLLRAASEAAAREARFQPPMISGKPVKFTGVIIYNFMEE
jgi:TonB family protein